MDTTDKSIDAYGFERGEDFDYEGYESFMSEYLAVLTKRMIKWQKIQPPSASFKKSRKLKRYVRKGIPKEYRAEMWMKISSAFEMKKQFPNKYKDLLASGDVEKSVKEAIHGDIGRTYPENIYFIDTDDGLLGPLSNVLTAYAIHNPSVGYCQGLNYITGMLLLVTKNETDAFWLLQQMLDELLPDFYMSKMHGLRVECRVLDLLLLSAHPDLHAHFKKYQVDMEIVATKWFICLFMDVLPIETVLRVWDCLFFEGNKIILRVAYSLIVINKEKFLEKGNFTDIYGVFKEITHDKNSLDCHSFLKLCFTVPKSFSRSHIKKLRLKAAEGIRTNNP